MLNKIKILPLQTTFKYPSYNHEGDAGLDIFLLEDIEILPGERLKIPSGFSLEIPDGFFGAIAPRSGLADKYGITVLNAWGVIDSTYRGEISVIIINLGKQKVKLDKNSKIAQLIILPYVKVDLEKSGMLSKTDRGSNGFGSSGD